MDSKTVLLAMLLASVVSAGAANAQPPDVVQIGVLLSLTGKLSALGEHLHPTVVMAGDDLNRYLEEAGHPWRVSLVIEDTGTSPVVSLEKIQALHARGVDIVVGPVSSASVSQVISYANDNNMIVIAPVSSSPALAIPHDPVFRLAPDDRNQGRAMSALLDAEGIDALIPVWRGDTYGDGLRDAVAADFESRGGTVYGGIRYNPETAEFSVSASSLADGVSEAVRHHGAERVAVLVISFEEVVPLLQAASYYDTLHAVRWFGSQAIAQSTPIISDGIALQFAQNTGLASLQLWQAPGVRADSISDRLAELLGEAPNTYAYNVYDALWLAGMTILDTGSADPRDIRAAIHDVAGAGIGGALSSTTLNGAGDLALGNYRVWSVSGGSWVPGAIYHGEDDTIRMGAPPGSGEVLLEYGPNSGSTRQPTATQLLQDEIGWVNEVFLLPYDVKLTARECSEDSAHYRQGGIAICYELVDGLYGMWSEFDGDPEYADTFALYNAHETFHHGLGHAILDMYDIRWWESRFLALEIGE